MARAAGIEMSDCRLLEENGRAHFMTRRFDRIGNERVHMHSLCAVAHIDFRLKGVNAYEQLFPAIDGLRLGEEARIQAFLRMCLNVMAANCDDHSKNFAFVLRRGRSWAFSPAYDITHAFNPEGERTYQHLMSVNGKFGRIARKDLASVGERFDIPRVKRLLGQVQAAVARWFEFGAEAGLSAASIRRVRKDFPEI